MRSKFNGVILLLVASLAAVIFGVYRTNPQDAPAPPRTGRRATDLVTVDQSSLITVEKLVRMTITPPERALAADALRLADQDMDLAFAQAVR